jgi:hypothetical protein
VSVKQTKDFVSETRDDLGATLDEIEHRLSPANLTKQALHMVSQSYERHPARWLIIGGVALVGSVAAVLWAFLSDD